jgi:hypothetical protein
MDRTDSDQNIEESERWEWEFVSDPEKTLQRLESLEDGSLDKIIVNEQDSDKIISGNITSDSEERVDATEEGQGGGRVNLSQENQFLTEESTQEIEKNKENPQLGKLSLISEEAIESQISATLALHMPLSPIDKPAQPPEEDEASPFPPLSSHLGEQGNLPISFSQEQETPSSKSSTASAPPFFVSALVALLFGLLLSSLFSYSKSMIHSRM